MRRTSIIMCFVAVFAVSCSSVKNANVDYAHEYDFSGIETFQYLDTGESNIKNSLMADRVVALIKEKMRGGGLTEVNENPDIVVTYHFTTQEQTSYNTTTMGYGGYGAGWRRWGYGGAGTASSTTYATTYVDGTLVVDAFDPENKNLIWRGTGTVTVKDNPDKQIQQIEQVLGAIGDEWRKILAEKSK